jgi:uncharacterized protein (TIGR00251 family)
MFTSDSPAGCLLTIRVTPRAGRSAIAGVREDLLLVKLAAAPVDGAANEALVATLAEALGVPKRDVSIVSGERSRTKRVLVAGRTAAAVAAALAPFLAER